MCRLEPRFQALGFTPCVALLGGVRSEAMWARLASAAACSASASAAAFASASAAKFCAATRLHVRPQLGLRPAGGFFCFAQLGASGKQPELLRPLVQRLVQQLRLEASAAALGFSGFCFRLGAEADLLRQRRLCSQQLFELQRSRQLQLRLRRAGLLFCGVYSFQQRLSCIGLAFSLRLGFLAVPGPSASARHRQRAKSHHLT